MKFISILFSILIINTMHTSNKINNYPMKNIALVYPEKLPENRKELVEFYFYFINILIESPEVNEITIIHRRGLKESLIKDFTSSKIRLIEINTVQDIWIRDYAPFYWDGTTAFKGIYNPSYFIEKNGKTLYSNKNPSIFYYAEFDDKVGSELAKLLNINTKKIDLIIDGGNFIHNGKGIAITTNRIISENESLSIQQIKDIFKKELGMSKIIILPVEPGDDTGHIDGMVRFINDSTVLVGGYDDDLALSKNFMNEIAKTLEESFKVVRIINGNLKVDKSKKISSAFGNYVNYLQVGNTVFLPQYGLKEKDKDARIVLEKYFNVVLVDNDVKKLANEWGVLNCITWNY
jgi:agmatine deiminase